MTKKTGVFKRVNGILAKLTFCLMILGMNTMAKAASLAWNFTGSGSEGFVGNERTFTAGGITVTANAWSYGSSFQEARLGQWSTGITVCGVPEACSNPAHQVDNVGQHEFVLLRFSAPIDPLSVRINPYGTYDRDVSYWTGNVHPSLDLTGRSYSDLANLGFLARIDNNGTTSSSYRDVSISNPSSVNALLFGAKLNGASGGEDRFKITKMSGGTVPGPGTLLMFAFGVAALFYWHRSSSHRMHQAGVVRQYYVRDQPDRRLQPIRHGPPARNMTCGWVTVSFAYRSFLLSCCRFS